MEFLLDTNILLWWQLSPKKLSRKIYAHIEDPWNIMYYSPVSLWEIATKYGTGKLPLNERTPEQFLDKLEADNMFDCLELLPGTLVTSYQLPMRHRDPFDRMLVWEALQHDLILVTADETLRAYEQDGLRLMC